MVLKKYPILIWMPVLVTVCRARTRNEVGVFLSSVSMCVLMAYIEVQIHNTVSL